MKEELHDRIQRVLDAGDGLVLDDGLEEALAEAGDEARAEAEALAEVDATLRAFPEAELDDDAAEAIATRIEQRLDDDDLARMPDPVAPPIFADKEGQPPRKSTAPKKKDKPAADYSLANLTSLSVKDAPAVKPDAPLRRPPQKPVEREVLEADELGLEQLPDSAPPPPAPPPAPAVASATEPATATATEPKKEPTQTGDERTSIPSVPPMDLKGAEESKELPPPPVDLEEVRERRKKLFVLGSGLAAAAAVVVVAVTGLSTMGAEEDMVAMSPEAVGSAELEEAAADPSYAPAEPAPAPGEAYAGARSRDEADLSVAAADTAAVVEAPDEEAEDEEIVAEAEAEPEASARGAAATETSEARPRRRRATSERTMARPAAMAAPRNGSGSSMATPSRAQVLRAMRAIQSRAEACGGTRHGTVQVNVTVSGSTGRVRNAVVQGEFAGTREGSCVARAVRRARFPEFSRDSFSFTYPFRI